MMQPERVNFGKQSLNTLAESMRYRRYKGFGETVRMQCELKFSTTYQKAWARYLDLRSINFCTLILCVILFTEENSVALAGEDFCDVEHASPPLQTDISDAYDQVMKNIINDKINCAMLISNKISDDKKIKMFLLGISSALDFNNKIMYKYSINNLHDAWSYCYANSFKFNLNFCSIIKIMEDMLIFESSLAYEENNKNKPINLGSPAFTFSPYGYNVDSIKFFRPKECCIRGSDSDLIAYYKNIADVLLRLYAYYSIYHFQVLNNDQQFNEANFLAKIIVARVYFTRQNYGNSTVHIEKYEKLAKESLQNLFAWPEFIAMKEYIKEKNENSNRYVFDRTSSKKFYCRSRLIFLEKYPNADVMQGYSSLEDTPIYRQCMRYVSKLDMRRNDK